MTNSAHTSRVGTKEGKVLVKMYPCAPGKATQLQDTCSSEHD